jgi:hypothetical protein
MRRAKHQKNIFHSNCVLNRVQGQSSQSGLQS